MMTDQLLRLLQLVLIFVLFVVDVTQAQDTYTLLDLIQPKSTQRIFDTISSSVANEYDGQQISFDESSRVHNFEERPINYEKLNSKYKDYLYEGDMLIHPKQLENIYDIGTKLRSKRKAYVDRLYPTTIWSSGVPYSMHPSLSQSAVNSINRAINFWQAETCINFRRRTNEWQYIEFIGNDEGCWSTVGRDTVIGKQVVSIGRGCEHFGVTSHELAHGLGLFHEQSRWDRDSAVTVNTRVVANYLLFNFAKIPRNELSIYNLPYDIGSVMHYTPTEFSNSRSVPALLANDPNLQQTMGQMEGPSFLDVAIMNLHYKCAAKCRNTLNCANGGYINPRTCNTCKCPTGFGGTLCQNIGPSFSGGSDIFLSHLNEPTTPSGCGGVIQAQATVRRFSINIRQVGQIRQKQCIYHIQAPAGKQVLVNLIRVDARCIEGCWVDAAEFKMKADVRQTGYRFCCSSQNQRRMISDRNFVPVIMTSRQGNLNLIFEYAYVDARRSNDDGEAVIEEIVPSNSTMVEIEENHLV